MSNLTLRGAVILLEFKRYFFVCRIQKQSAGTKTQKKIATGTCSQKGPQAQKVEKYVLLQSVSTIWIKIAR